ncbi:MAG: type II secretion system protein [Bdellovibrionota bacterium]|nr:MAG: type II secretion system protein [Bdellovibrionota bacterium]
MRMKATPHTARRSACSGFTLIEVLVSMGLIAVVGASIFQGFVGQVRMNTLSQERARAAAAAQVVLDAYRLEDPAEMPESGEENVEVDVGGHSFTVTTSFCAEPSFCTSNRIRHLRVEVTRNDEILFRADTVYAQLR